MKLHFLGTGGGRFVTASQNRKTAGMILETEDTMIYIDPGPGALVHSQSFETEKIDGIVVSHSHLDHDNDAEALIEKITQLHENPCIIAGSESVLNGHGDIEKSVSEYHKSMCSKVYNLSEEEAEIGGLEIEAQEMFHTDPKCVGLKISDREKKFGFWTDTGFSDELLDFYEDCDTLIINCHRPRNANLRGYTSLDEVPDIVKSSDASTAIITHFGKKFLDSDMEEEKAWIKEQLDKKVIFAEDGMTFPGDRKLDSF